MGLIDVTEQTAQQLIAKHHVVELRVPADSSYWVDFVLGDGRVLGMADGSNEERRGWYLTDDKVA